MTAANIKVYEKTIMSTTEIDFFNFSEMCMKENRNKALHMEFSIYFENYQKRFLFHESKIPYVEFSFNSLSYTSLKK